jgi:hypothetical protein
MLWDYQIFHLRFTANRYEENLKCYAPLLGYENAPICHELTSHTLF